MRTRKLAFLFVSNALVLSGCASTTPTTVTKTAYVIYDVKPNGGARYQEVFGAFVDGTKKYLSHANVLEDPPPYPLPEAPGRFQDTPLSQMKGMQGLAAMAAMSGASLPSVVTCPGAVATVRGADNDFSHYGKNTTYTFCLYRYHGGYQADGVATYTSQSGFSADPAVLGAALGGVFTRAIGLGSPSTFIESSFGHLKTELSSVGSVSTAASFDPFAKS